MGAGMPEGESLVMITDSEAFSALEDLFSGPGKVKVERDPAKRAIWDIGVRLSPR
jgi:hypothetical protein